jgi:hypothetical protein
MAVDPGKRGEIVLGPFGGSGTTLIAAEKTGRLARLIEFDPAYCDTILHRFERVTSKQATSAASGASFEEIAQERAVPRRPGALFAPFGLRQSLQERRPELAAASTAEAAAFSLGNSPMANQSWWPKVKYHPMSLPPTLLKSLATASSRFSGLASMPLIAFEVKRPREM